MLGSDSPETAFAVSALLFQVVLIIHFALRTWRFATALRYGPIVYALGVPAAGVSILLLLAGKPWSLWLSGFLYLIWAFYGYVVEYVKKIEWRNPVRWSVFGPYVFLYLATVMFYWWPLALVQKPLWYVYAALFIISTVLNAVSHKGPAEGQERD
ncbi:MAG: hypothetical protein H5T62_01795 [Anaerolineae bacterium]|nr:hypothetical protein [Anaerolineae bacterium]